MGAQALRKVIGDVKLILDQKNVAARQVLQGLIHGRSPFILSSLPASLSSG